MTNESIEFQLNPQKEKKLPFCNNRHGIDAFVVAAEIYPHPLDFHHNPLTQ